MGDQAAGGLLSPFLRRRRVAAALPYLRGAVLDVGCGSGALAACVAPADYRGVDSDAASLARARADFPQHRFGHDLPGAEERFDTVVALAVIEHVPDAATFLRSLGGYLRDAESSVVCTTPHPALDSVHGMGARLGLFSREAHDEHEQMLDRDALRAAGEAAGLRMAHYERFLGGANQLAVFRRVA